MQLYNTKVVPSAADALWIAPDLPEMEGRKLLAISVIYNQGSAEEETLRKMMAACKLLPSDYAVFQVEADKIYSWQTLAANGAPDVVLLLGVSPAQLSIHALFRRHAPNEFAGHTFIPALSLEEIDRNPAAKKDLWSNGLKPVFGL